MRKTSIPDLFWIFIILQIILHYFLPVKQIINYPYNLLGIVLIIPCLYLNWIWAAKRFRKEKTTLDPHKSPRKFITDGPFRFSRNPTYLSMAITFLGLSILLGSISSFAIPLIFIILTNSFTISLEEKNMKKKFGRKYINYRKRVRRWI